MPFTVIDVPAVPEPGMKVAPALIWVPAAVPVPPSVPPFTAKAALARLPLTISVPAPTENAVMPVLAPVSVQLPLPVFAPASNEESWATFELPDPLPLGPACRCRTPQHVAVDDGAGHQFEAVGEGARLVEIDGAAGSSVHRAGHRHGRRSCRTAFDGCKSVSRSLTVPVAATVMAIGPEPRLCA